MLLLFTTLLTAAFIFYHTYWKRRNLPPGPIPLPFIGNLLTLSFYEPGYEAFRLWKKKYGRCFTFWMADRPAIVLADYELMKQTLIKDGGAYTGRQDVPLSRVMRGGDYGITATTGGLWQQHRRFALHVFKDFGMGKDIMQERVLDEVKDFLSKCELKPGEPLDLRDHIDSAVGSIINAVLFGFRFDESNMDQFYRQKAVLVRVMELGAQPAFIMFMLFPSLGILPFFKAYSKEVKENGEVLFNMFDEQIEIHKAQIDFDCEENADYVEAYLKEQKRLENEPENGGFTHAQLRNMCFDLWMAGMETTSNTLYWGVLYVVLHDEVQKSIHSEMDTVIGCDRLITNADRSEMHYMNAVINEIQRVANLLPLNVFHETTCDVNIDGYHIPSGTLVLPQISTVMYDEKVFPNPYDFDPSRHLAEDGTFVRIDEMIPFSMGKRQCLGESLARMELFLFLANFFHKFEVSTHGDQPPSTVKKFGGTVRAQDFCVVLKPRN
ncbi:Unspecific monooxygenase [Trichostrongylus colubriformis]|uniref:Unspecific monooxygenase n=1 Tax=Trichostrongylus colubriformis TaxID=6319 RepID=A0AAN8IBE2_TRICO